MKITNYDLLLANFILWKRQISSRTLQKNNSKSLPQILINELERQFTFSQFNWHNLCKKGK